MACFFYCVEHTHVHCRKALEYEKKLYYIIKPINLSFYILSFKKQFSLNMGSYTSRFVKSESDYRRNVVPGTADFITAHADMTGRNNLPKYVPLSKKHT